MIGIVDYGLGNTQAFVNIYEQLNIPVFLAKTKNDLSKATHIILPGVGSFDWAMDRLNGSGMRSELDNLVLNSNLPVLGICIGMQIMSLKSSEGKSHGLGWINAEVKKLDNSKSNNKIRLPHMGWNTINIIDNIDIFHGLETEARFYFLHSYFVEPVNLSDILATSEYGCNFTSAIRNKKKFGVQFHPEKSHTWGTQVLKNFSQI
jgi:imidazole glycerol-phosphate synthase subunit HisH